jgi:ABC-type Fe3+-siderophore transport system permease subunit
LEQPRVDVDSANFRATIITSFLLGATMILLSLNVSVIKQNASASVLGTTEWWLALSVMVMLFAAMIMLFLSYVILQTMYLAPFASSEKLTRVAWARAMLGTASFLIPTSFGSTFLVGFGVSNPGAWVFGGVGYGSGVT